MLGIALSRSEYTNGMVFCNPIVNSFSTSADYLADKNRHAGEVFLLFNTMGGGGGVTTSVLSEIKLMLLQNLLLVNKYLYRIRKCMIY